jgi:hypothetical protein
MKEIKGTSMVFGVAFRRAALGVFFLAFFVQQSWAATICYCHERSACNSEATYIQHAEAATNQTHAKSTVSHVHSGTVATAPAQVDLALAARESPHQMTSCCLAQAQAETGIASLAPQKPVPAEASSVPQRPGAQAIPPRATIHGPPAAAGSPQLYLKSSSLLI